MFVVKVTGLLLILVPLTFNAAFFLLQRRFDYPDILRRPASEILTRFRQGGSSLIALWYAFAFSALLFLPVAILVPQALAPGNSLLVAAATAVGLLAGLVQVLGLIRWPFLVPGLAEAYASPTSSEATRDAVIVVFQSFHRYAGVAIGEHLGYLFTSIWTVLVAVAVLESPVLPSWMGLAAIIPAVGIFIGLFEEAGFKPAGAINAISYILWSLWLVVAGLMLLFAQAAP